MSMFTSDGQEVLPHNDAVPSLDSIATGLARQIRFGGQTDIPYSVLCHTLCLAEFFPPHERIFPLMHDATEAVVSDVVRPWKPQEFIEMEHRLLERICRYYGLPWPWPDEVVERLHEMDRIMGNSEGYALGFFPSDAEYIYDASGPMMDAVARWMQLSPQLVIQPAPGVAMFKQQVASALLARKEHLRGKSS